MRIKFGQMWGKSFASSHFEKNARRNTDLLGPVNYNSRQDRRSELAPPVTSPRPSNQVVFVAFDTRKIAGKRCARLVCGLRLRLFSCSAVLNGFGKMASHPNPRRVRDEERKKPVTHAPPDRKLNAPLWKKRRRENSC
jgi:hypothetical protein